MRVIAGTAKGRKLRVPAGLHVRPSGARLRESAFGILEHRGAIDGARVLDLFAGTGALGLEAMSRGAAFALFVDNGAEARALLRRNVEALGLGGATKIYRRDATALGQAHPHAPFTLAFCDPPYGKDLASRALASLRAGGWLAPEATVIVEEATASRFAAPEGYGEIDRRAYDDTEFVILRLVP